MEEKNDCNKILIEKIIKNLQNNNEILKIILEETFKMKIENLEITGFSKCNNIEEYNFSLIKINLLFQNKIQQKIDLKMIKGGKIKETIFCYWSLLYEEFLKNNKEKIINIPKKATISQKSKDESNSNLVLTLSQDLNYCAQINLIELKKFKIKEEKNNKKVERWVKSLETNEDILFIGKRY